MAEGNFYPNAALHLQVEGNTYTVSMTNSMEEDAPDYTGEATLRVYCEDADNTVIEVAQDGEYTEVESTVIGSYRQFTMEVPGSFRTVEVEGSHTLLIVLCIVGKADEDQSGTNESDSKDSPAEGTDVTDAAEDAGQTADAEE